MGDEGFDALWAKVIEDWGDEKRHAAILAYALETENLPELAGRYRALKDDPEKGAYAQKRIDAIVVSATQMLASMKTPPPPKQNKPLTIAVAIVSACVISWLAWQVFGRH
jgi:hypothetical protein